MAQVQGRELNPNIAKKNLPQNNKNTMSSYSLTHL
jgi:hypothetical protein